MYTGIKVHSKFKKKLYPVRPDKVLWTFLIISRVQVSNGIIFYFYPFGMYSERVHSYLQTQNTTTKINGTWRTIIKETCLKSFH